MIDLNVVKAEFSAFDRTAHDQPLVYLDSAATSLKPRRVVDTICDFYRYNAANVHRGAYDLSSRATESFEEARKKVRKFIGAESENEIIFTRGTTDSINLVAQTFGRQKLEAGDEIILSEMEHHSNIVPWQLLAEEKGIVIRWIPVDDNGDLQIEGFKNLLNERTRLISVVHGSNTLGTLNSIEEIIALGHRVGAKVLIDAAQSVTFRKLDVQRLDCDFLTFSGHKLYGPFGVGVLYGKLDLLNDLKPLQGGGAMIDKVTKEASTFLESPQRFEAGTPHVAGVIGLGSAIDYVQAVGLEQIERHAKEILNYAVEKLCALPGIHQIGPSKTRVNLISFIFDGLNSNDIGQILDQLGIAVRVGHHCTQPLMRRFNVPATIRASFGVYNSADDVDKLVKGLKKAEEILR